MLIVAILAIWLAGAISLLLALRAWRRRREAPAAVWMAVLMAGIVIPFTLNFAYSLGFKPGGFLDLTPVGFMGMGLLLFHGVFRVGLFDVFPQALDALYDRLPDALFVLNRQRNVVNANPAGASLLRDPAFQRDYVEKDPGANRAVRLAISGEHGEQDVGLGDKTWHMRILPLQSSAEQITTSSTSPRWRPAR